MMLRLFVAKADTLNPLLGSLAKASFLGPTFGDSHRNHTIGTMDLLMIAAMQVLYKYILLT